MNRIVHAIFRLAVALVAALGVSAPVGAASYEIFGWELNPYVGGAFGRSTSGADCGSGGVGDEAAQLNTRGAVTVTLALAAPLQTLECDGATTGFKIYGGMRVHEYLALEGGYVALGEHPRIVRGRVTDNGNTYEGNADVMVEHDGSWTGSFVGMLPVARITPRTVLPSGEVIALGRLGMHSWSVLANSPAVNLPFVPPEGSMETEDDLQRVRFAHESEDSGADLYFGVGAEYLLDNGVGVRLEWERYLFNGEWREADIDMISFGAVYRF